jgi:hypothetical protein
MQVPDHAGARPIMQVPDHASAQSWGCPIMGGRQSVRDTEMLLHAQYVAYKEE